MLSTINNKHSTSGTYSVKLKRVFGLNNKLYTSTAVPI